MISHVQQRMLLLVAWIVTVETLHSLYEKFFRNQRVASEKVQGIQKSKRNYLFEINKKKYEKNIP